MQDTAIEGQVRSNDICSDEDMAGNAMFRVPRVCCKSCQKREKNRENKRREDEKRERKREKLRTIRYDVIKTTAI